jgi:hypothetical protein
MWQKIRRILRSTDILLIPIIGLAVYLVFLPHHDYPYLVHLDEWTQLASSNEIIRQGDLRSLTNPFLGGAPGWNQVGEVGSNLVWAVFHQISGIPWLDIYKYFPSIIFVMTVLSAYIVGRRRGFGWEAALFTCLVPTTVGILGPGFLVPVAMGLPFIPLSFFVAFHYRTVWSYLALLLLVGGLATIHPPTAACLVVALIPYILLSVKGNLKHSLALTLVLVIPFIALFTTIYYMALPAGRSLFIPHPLNPNVDLPGIIQTYGYLPTIFCLCGVLYLALKGGKENYGLTLGLLALLSVLAVYFVFHYGVDIIYYRGLLSMMLLMSIIAGAGLMAVKNLKLPEKLVGWLKLPVIAHNIGGILCLILIGVTLYVAIPYRQNIPYYHMIDSGDYEAFVWIRDNLSSAYDKAILDPWQGTAFTAITGKKVYSLIGEAPTATDYKAYEFLDSGCKDSNFLRENGISIVYTRSSCNNTDLVETRENVYLLKEVGKQ